MFASTHSNLDENTVTLLQAHQTALASKTDSTPSAVQESAVEAADATVHSEVPSGPSVELADKVTNGFADTTANPCQELVSAQVSGTSPSADIITHAFYGPQTYTAYIDPALTRAACSATPGLPNIT